MSQVQADGRHKVLLEHTLGRRGLVFHFYSNRNPHKTNYFCVDLIGPRAWDVDNWKVSGTKQRWMCLT